MLIKIFLVSVAALGVSASSYGKGKGSYYTTPDECVGDVIEVMSQFPKFDTILTLIEDAGLTDTLKDMDSSPYTIFAPTDAAFLAAGIDEALLMDQDTLQDILLYHVLGQNLESSDFRQKSYTTLQGDDIDISFVESTGYVFVNDLARVVKFDDCASNGFIHTIDDVLLPPIGPITPDYTPPQQCTGKGKGKGYNGNGNDCQEVLPFCSGKGKGKGYSGYGDDCVEVIPVPPTMPDCTGKGKGKGYSGTEKDCAATPPFCVGKGKGKGYSTGDCTEVPPFCTGKGKGKGYSGSGVDCTPVPPDCTVGGKGKGYIGNGRDCTPVPTPEPTPYPTPYPTKAPTPYPTKAPTPYPTKAPTPYPTEAPTSHPTEAPTPHPTEDPTPAPTAAPTEAPTPDPTPGPTPEPSPMPTPDPTSAPTPMPTPDPTPAPTPGPTSKPTPAPTPMPTPDPTPAPTCGGLGTFCGDGTSCCSGLICPGHYCEFPCSEMGGPCGVDLPACCGHMECVDADGDDDPNTGICLATKPPTPAPTPAPTCANLGMSCDEDAGEFCCSGLLCNDRSCEFPCSVTGGPCGTNLPACCDGFLCFDTDGDGDPHTGLCAMTAAPTKSPTPAPTPAPTPHPTEMPTPDPTPAPSPMPTSAPTPAPTPSPTPAPTPLPTPSPTDMPTPAPTPSPTDMPTPAPTPMPTPDPTPAPTPAPTPDPTPMPTPAPTTLAPTATPVIFTDKTCYESGEDIFVDYYIGDPSDHDWIGFYPADLHLDMINTEPIMWLWSCGTQHCSGNGGQWNTLKFGSYGEDESGLDSWPLDTGRYVVLMSSGSTHNYPVRILGNVFEVAGYGLPCEDHDHHDDHTHADGDHTHDDDSLVQDHDHHHDETTPHTHEGEIDHVDTTQTTPADDDYHGHF